ncbi:HPr kinase/phosphorylase [Telmatospirillum siberiense]|uniref:Serine/threonine protein kinase n=1 Tax=Telmatospirillum siberiense TaxID=382514 RepID=A0A2N3PM77_9PROT|nr:serine/threonine protein kinase [Telmatospirillum siberiense]PKU21495.1 serine/threonine protein kinase [Telmatospirillum siberiense]
MIRLHGTCVIVGESGVVLRGPSGAGKSDLALRLIDTGARLVADDQMEIEREDDRLSVRAPTTIAGLIEVRGVGILKIDHAPSAPLDLIVDLVAAEMVERLPQTETEEICGLARRRLTLCPWESSAAAKVRLAVRALTGNIMSI